MNTQPDTSAAPTWVGSNVKAAYNISAADAEGFEWMPTNGMNRVQGALNITLAENHHTIVNRPLPGGGYETNPQTLGYFGGAVYNSLWYGGEPQ